MALSVLAMPALAQMPRHNPPAGLSCPGDTMVWVNTRSGIYHYPGERYYGSTKHERFECERQAISEGDRARRNGQ